MSSKDWNIRVVMASESDFTIIRNLVPYYVYDISEYTGWNCDVNGRWDGCEELPDYWEQTNHHPYLITVNDDVAGFVLIRPLPGELERREIGDFFVARKFKRTGVGSRSAYLAMDNHPGKWAVRVLDDNSGALHFWSNAIHQYTGGVFTKTSEQFEDPHSGSWKMQIYRFDNFKRNAGVSHPGT